MRDGVIVEQGDSRKIFEEPETEYTHALLDAALDMKADEVVVRQ